MQMELLKRYFPKVENADIAASLARQGAYGVIIFVAMYVVGLMVAAFFDLDPVNLQPLGVQDVRDQVIGSAIVIPILMAFAYRVFVGKGWLVAALVLAWFVGEASWKVASGSANAGWVIFYAAVAAMMVNGVRGCWWLRNRESDRESVFSPKAKRVFGVTGSLAAAAIVVALGMSIGNAPPSMSPVEEVAEGFRMAADQINARGPVMVDEETSLNRAEAGPGARLTYFFSLPNHSSDEIDADRLVAGVRPNTITVVCQNDDMKVALQNGGTLVYVYSGKDELEIARFEVSGPDCAQGEA
jgi:hypothetical protein